MNIKDAQYYEKEIGGIKRELGKLPEGHLQMKGSYYYEAIGSVQKGISKDKLKVRQLARKAYLLKRLEHLELNFSIAKKHFARCRTEDQMEIIRGLPPIYQTLPVYYFFHPSVQVQVEDTCAEKKWRPDGLIYLTESGIHVRSKSELIIANALSTNNIPFHYEAALVLGGICKYPDFTINRPSDGKLFLWEHLGLMEQDEYRRTANEKMALYARYGFYPFDNLIFTYEQDIKNPAHINALIEMFLLQ